MHLIRRDGKWHADFLDHRDTRRRWVLFGDKRASQRYADRLDALVARRIAGEPLDRELSEWLAGLPRRYRDKLTAIGIAATGTTEPPSSADVDDYEAWLETQNLHPRHASGSANVIRRCLQAVPGLDAEGVSTYLARLRTENGRSIATSNRHLQSLKAFCAWRVRTGRASDNPLTGLARLNEETDRRHDRCVFTTEQLATLLDYVRTADVIHHMTGEQRYWAYRLASELGLLAGEMRKLTAAAFTLGKKPSVRLSAAAAPKRRTTHVLPLADDTARGLRRFLPGVGRGDHPFPLPRQTAVMLYADLDAAGIPHQDEQGRFRDFYALRHTALTNLAQASPLHVVKAVARHRNITTTQRYTHATEEDMRVAINKRPAK